jgi:uncharacterized membrane protein
MLFFYWNCPDRVVLCYFSIRTVLTEPHCQNSSNIHEKQQNTTVRTDLKSNRKTTKCHTVRTVPTSMKNNKIPHCQDSSNRKTTKYHTVRTVPTSMKNNISIGTVLTVWYFVIFHRCWNCPDSVAFCCFSIGF